jgi:prepilin-type N-terminal cleavage/methylation domain-containing protein
MRQGCSGFTLVELLIVIALIGIAAGIATINFSQLTKKTNIEKQTKELFSDLNDARLKSIYTKKRHSIVLQSNSYVFKEYSSVNEDRSAGMPLLSKTVSNTMTTENGGSLANVIIEFDIRGFTYDFNTIRMNPVNSGAAYDCVLISDARTNMGQMGSGNVCSQK